MRMLCLQACSNTAHYRWRGSGNQGACVEVAGVHGGGEGVASVGVEAVAREEVRVQGILPRLPQRLHHLMRAPRREVDIIGLVVGQLAK